MSGSSRIFDPVELNSFLMSRHRRRAGQPRTAGQLAGARPGGVRSLRAGHDSRRLGRADGGMVVADAPAVNAQELTLAAGGLTRACVSVASMLVWKAALPDG